MSRFGITSRLPAGRLVVAVAALIAAVGAGPTNPSFAADPNSGQSQLVPAAIAPWARAAPASAAGHAPVTATPTSPPSRSPAAAAASPDGSTSAATAAASTATAQQSPIAVVRWGLSASRQRDVDGAPSVAAVAGRPLYLWLTVEGGQVAVDQLRTGGRLAIDLHWARDDGSTAAGAPNLTTELTIGQPGLVATLAGQVERQGHFEWHLWARKDALSPGRWTVSLTYPDGQPVACGEAQPRPCRLLVDVG
jgi:hypothetical protein